MKHLHRLDAREQERPVRACIERAKQTNDATNGSDAVVCCDQGRTVHALTLAINWRAQVAATLPGGTGVICLDSTPDDGDSQATPGCDGVGVLYVVKVWWVDEKLDPATPQRFVTSVLP